MNHERLVREPERRNLTGISTSSWYALQDEGLAPPPVRISKAAVAWPHSELSALNAARIAGWSDDQIRVLVQRMLAARRRSLDEIFPPASAAGN